MLHKKVASAPSFISFNLSLYTSEDAWKKVLETPVCPCQGRQTMKIAALELAPKDRQLIDLSLKWN